MSYHHLSQKDILQSSVWTYLLPTVESTPTVLCGTHHPPLKTGTNSRKDPFLPTWATTPCSCEYLKLQISQVWLCTPAINLRIHNTKVVYSCLQKLTVGLSYRVGSHLLKGAGRAALHCCCPSISLVKGKDFNLLTKMILNVLWWRNK